MHYALDESYPNGRIPCLCRHGRDHTEELHDVPPPITPSPDEIDRLRLEQLRNELKVIAIAEGGPLFMGWPSRWWDTYLRRCVNGHVSSWTLKSEALGRDACLAAGCMAPVAMTFPEDRDGPLRPPYPWCTLVHPLTDRECP